jgi:hypothetical protein
VPRLGLPAILFLAACAAPVDDDGGDTGFQVKTVIPTDGTMEVIDLVNPELRVNASADAAACSPDNILFAPVHGNTVLFDVPYTVTLLDGGRKIVIVPDTALLEGYWYMVSVLSGSGGCMDEKGRRLQPFSSNFYVP